MFEFPFQVHKHHSITIFFCHLQRHEIVNGVIQVEGVSDESSIDQKSEQTVGGTP